MTNPEPLTRRVKRGASWGALSTVALRSGSLVLGIVLARMLSPADFGVYAIALTVQTILVSLADFGLGTELIRTDRFEEKAPTVASLGLAAGCVFALVMAVAAVPMAGLLGSDDAAGVIALLSLTLPLAGLGIIPWSKLAREFRQRELFLTSAVDFVVGGIVTVALVKAGMGPIALAVGRVVAQSCATALQFKLSSTRPSYGFQRQIARETLTFGAPLALANLLSWASLNVDNVIIARSAGGVALGYYVLAFNISTWPMSVIGQSLRAVSLPAFAHIRRGPGSVRGGSEHILPAALGVTWLLATPAGAGLAALSTPLVRLLYGEQWLPAAEVLAALGLFGVLRVAVDVMASYLVAAGSTRPVLAVQILWIVMLVPAMIISVERWGVVGGGWAHVGVAALVLLPAYTALVCRSGVRLWPMLIAMAPPMLAAIPLWIVVRWIGDRAASPATALLLGVPAGGAVYIALVLPWAHRLRRSIAMLFGAGEADDGDTRKWEDEPAVPSSLGSLAVSTSAEAL